LLRLNNNSCRVSDPARTPFVDLHEQVSHGVASAELVEQQIAVSIDDRE
jgi:hypothetical protein